MSEREFEGAERFVHWCYAALFLGLVLTGALLVWSPAARAIAIGGQRLVPLIHFGLGLALLVAPFLPLAWGRGESLGRDLRAWLRWRPADLVWLALAPLSIVAPRLPLPAQPRFNAGQRLNALWSLAAWALLGLTGLAIWSGRALPIRWREAAYDWHVLLALLSVAVLAGHVAMAAAHPASMRAMLRGPARPRRAPRR
ncbi:MAG TPA: cytochrome b/b6 domain-containing protein [Chloroflexota bacterium]